MKLFTGIITEYFVHAQALCTRTLLRGRGLGMRLVKGSMSGVRVV